MADGPKLIPDYRRFVEGLDVEQVAFLHVQLQSVRGQKVVALREAVLDRILDDPQRDGVRERMEQRFYRKVGRIRPRKRR